MDEFRAPTPARDLRSIVHSRYGPPDALELKDIDQPVVNDDAVLVPARDTQAVGVATFKLREDGTALGFKVNVANIDNPFAAHIYCGAVGVNGPINLVSPCSWARPREVR